MTLASLMEELRQTLRLQSLTPDADGVYSLVFDEGLDLEILGLGTSHLLVRSKLFDVPTDDQERELFLRDHLQHNLARLQQQSAVLSLDEPGRQLWLAASHRIDSLSPREFGERIEQFVNSLDWWRRLTAPAPSSLFHVNMLRP